tara:strand:- start:410 stop:646 length:237 start_codon:yes stop_codon:yes gene_type:complete
VAGSIVVMTRLDLSVKDTVRIIDRKTTRKPLPQIIMEYEDILLQELMDTPGELYDLPEFKDEEKFDVDAYINNNDFTW